MSGQQIPTATPSQEGTNGLCRKLRMKSSMDDVRSPMFWKAAFAELLGTLLLVLTGIGSVIQGWQNDHLDVVQIALCFGLCVATAVWIVGHISGGHINPAVTMSFLVTRRISLARAIVYMIAQCVGAIAGAGLIKALTPAKLVGGLGTTTLNSQMTAAQGFTIELFLTMFLVLTVFATCDSNRTDHGGSYPLMIGLCVTMGHLWAVEYCGSSMNPARSLGPAVIMSIWKDHWIYWAGPLAGGSVGGILYEHVLSSNASIRKIYGCLLPSKFDDGKYPVTSVTLQTTDDEEKTQEITKNL